VKSPRFASKVLWLAIVAVALTLDRAAAADSTPAPSEYRFLIDPKLRSQPTAISITSVARLLFRGEDELLLRIEPEGHAHPLAILERLAAFALIDLPIASYELVIPHEVLGHGGRYREFGGDAKVHLGPPLPFEIPPTHRAYPSLHRMLYLDERTLASLGGLQTQATQQRDLAFTTFRSGVLRRGDSLLYAGHALTKIAQTFGANDLDAAASNTAARDRVNAKDYRRMLWLGALGEAADPLFWYSLYAAGYRYLIRGDRALAHPAFRVFGVRAFVTSRVLPVPWGVEPHLDVLLGTSRLDIDIALRPGFGPGGGSFAAQIDAMGIAPMPVLRINGGLAAWVQPGISAEAEVGPPSKDGPLIEWGPPLPGRPPPSVVIGGAAYIDIEAHRDQWFFWTRLGIKSVGLLVDQPVAAGANMALIGGLRL
jgi:hypothetical protein